VELPKSLEIILLKSSERVRGGGPVDDLTDGRYISGILCKKARRGFPGSPPRRLGAPDIAHGWPDSLEE